jgi:hypothetical protein
MTYLSLASMRIQFRTLTFHSRSKEQLQERLHLKKFVTSLPTVIGALVPPLGPYLETDLTTDLYSGSTLIAIMDKSDHQTSFNSLKKFVTLLLAAIGALGSPIGPHPESDLATDLYSGSTPIANMDESDHRISFNRLNKSAISLPTAIGASDSPLGPSTERDLVIDVHSSSTPIAIKEVSNRQIRYRQL